MSKPSRRPGREEFKEQARNKRRQRELRQQQREEGLIPLQVHTPSNCKSPYQSEEEETAARCESVSGLARIMRQQLPTLLKRLEKIPDPRNPKKTKYKMTLLMLYGILVFVFQYSSRRAANKAIPGLCSRTTCVVCFHNGMVIPLMSEFLDYEQGDGEKNKQDCEQRAFHRLAERIRKAFPRLPIMLLLDSLYANGPIMQHCHDYNWDFMIVLKGGSLSTVWEEYESLLLLEKDNLRQQKWGDRE